MILDVHFQAPSQKGNQTTTQIEEKIVLKWRIFTLMEIANIYLDGMIKFARIESILHAKVSTRAD